MRAREGGPLRAAFLTSAAIHGGTFLLLWVAATQARDLPKMRVYSVNIVSPPPQQLGEWSPAPAEPLPPLAEQKPEPQPEPEPAPAPKEPSPAPTPTRKPEAVKAPAAEKKPEAAKPVAEKPAPAKPAAPSTGARPDPNSPGGENLDVRVEGAAFVDPGYLANITRQLYRYFRPPPGARNDQAEVAFRINRDGSVSDIRIVSNSGSFQFRLRAMEAVEQAGLARAFGPLPKAYTADQLLISFYFRPAR